MELSEDYVGRLVEKSIGSRRLEGGEEIERLPTSFGCWESY